MLDRQLINEVLGYLAREKDNFAEVFVEQRYLTFLVYEDQRMEKVISGLERGVGLRVIFNEQTAYGYTSDFSRESLKKLAYKVREAALTSSKPANIQIPPPHMATPFPVKYFPDKIPVEQKVDLLTKIDCSARTTSGAVKQVAASYGDLVQEVQIANNRGIFVSDRRIRTRVAVKVVAKKGEVIQTGQEVDGGIVGFELFDRISPEEIGLKAARRALLMLEARPAPAGKMPVVMAAEAGGTMIHEACGHGLEADLVQKKLSIYAGRRNQTVASELVTVVDEAPMPEKYGSLRIDDEGVPGQKNVLIENGVLKNYIYDLLTASKEGLPFSTGNGRRESYQFKPVPRMTNTYIIPGETPPEEIVDRTASGLYVKKMGGGQVNTTNGDFVFDVSEGYLIENGRITEPVRGATLAGNGPQALKQIDLVGNDHFFAIGTCGKDGQGIPVSDAQPTIRIPELVIGGLLEK